MHGFCHCVFPVTPCSQADRFSNVILDVNGSNTTANFYMKQTWAEGAGGEPYGGQGNRGRF